eukprot:2853437-Prymnesium_polylepis.2
MRRLRLARSQPSPRARVVEQVPERRGQVAPLPSPKERLPAAHRVVKDARLAGVMPHAARQLLGRGPIAVAHVPRRRRRRHTPLIGGHPLVRRERPHTVTHPRRRLAVVVVEKVGVDAVGPEAARAARLRRA